MSRVGVLKISKQLLLDALALPADTVIEDARISFSQPDVVEFRIAQQWLPEAREGDVIPRVIAQFKRDDTGVVSFQGWVI